MKVTHISTAFIEDMDELDYTAVIVRGEDGNIYIHKTLVLCRSKYKKLFKSVKEKKVISPEHWDIIDIAEVFKSRNYKEWVRKFEYDAEALEIRL